ncbi:2-dehydro-3-deoxygalactonokinase [Inquilinus ginsengisoli]|uniref:2-dehydro-3-deoxygalactonokinase n=1 Tax=Inquilinus ginsengisoli TaxID=363840 RepID=UPI003D23F068
MLVALDWGTSSLRAWLLDGDGDGAVRDEAAAPLGILKVPGGDFDAVFRQIAEKWISAGATAAIASGMIGSRQGWAEAPYANCPADAAALVAKLIEVPTSLGISLRIVPGVSRVDADGIPDVMRGEEVQILGDAPATGRRLYVLPGTHSKWALAEDGRIAWFATSMTGEAFAVLAEHSILGRLMDGRAYDQPAFRRGLAVGAAAGGGLLRRLFSARTLGLFGELEPKAAGSYLSGLLIGAEVADARSTVADAIGAAATGAAPDEVTIVGGAELSARYAEAIEAAGLRSRIAPADTTVKALWRLAKHAELV